MGNFRSANTVKKVSPTAPVAPTIATFSSLLIMPSLKII
ncbi:hypothetical protein LDG_6671 [Legionella drancourtii LLAP12]|uniref:Uncharacterized protein n=1 Tax=Legionella drancourtii LLAP12 TaxID=658187 RepID=G9EN50_9GAMM|nr:hypothetical protein LDG_6671 [Legionella drancourtii LLAP12]